MYMTRRTLGLGRKIDMIKLNTFTLFLLIVLFSFSQANADNFINSYNLQAMVKSKWNILDSKEEPAGQLKPPRVLWRNYFTPPFPAVWPPQQKPQSVYYGYPRGFTFGRMTHSELIAKPWVKVTVQTNGLRKIESILHDIVELEAESLWYPYTKEVRNIYKNNASAPQLMANLTHSSASKPANRKIIRAYYCQWSENKVVSKSIKKSHKRFYAWLDCK
jgi:hypothetical protein